jgi:GT2 family glycosyltransferase
MSKNISTAFKSTVIRLVYLKIHGRQVFMNKYTFRLPVVGDLLLQVESKMMSKHTAIDRANDYEKWVKKNYPKQKELDTQRSRVLKGAPKISILVPTYNTNIQHLKECIESVIAQSYENWELCIADDASTNNEVKKVIEEYAKKDERIKYSIQKKNGHICKATNAALELASGEYIALLDHDDILWPNALYEVASRLKTTPQIDFIYTDEDKITEDGSAHVDPFFKPDWSPEFLRSINYITHFAVIRRSLVKKVGGFRPGYEGAQDWDLFLRVSRETNDIFHIPKVLYSWRKSANSTAQAPSAKDYAYVNQKKTLQDDIKARGYQAELDWQIPFSMWKVQYAVQNTPLVSIIIPTKNQFVYIERCLRSVYEKTSYKNIEVVVVDTGSTEERVWGLYEEYRAKFSNMKLLKWEKEFNFAAVCNYGAKESAGDHYLFLNNDTEVITETWVEDMLGYSQQKDIGAVGCRLYYPNGKVQHAGIILGVGGQNGTPGIAGHYFPAFSENPLQDPAMLLYAGGTRNFTAVTAACVMIEAKKFNKVKGFNPKYRIAFNDVDLCLKLHTAGFRSVYLPHVKLYHYESISVGLPGSKVRNVEEFGREIKMMLDSWSGLINDDPFYHPEFRRDLASARLEL